MSDTLEYSTLSYDDLEEKVETLKLMLREVQMAQTRWEKVAKAYETVSSKQAKQLHTIYEIVVQGLKPTQTPELTYLEALISIMLETGKS